MNAQQQIILGLSIVSAIGWTGFVMEHNKPPVVREVVKEVPVVKKLPRGLEVGAKVKLLYDYDVPKGTIGIIKSIPGTTDCYSYQVDWPDFPRKDKKYWCVGPFQIELVKE